MTEFLNNNKWCLERRDKDIKDYLIWLTIVFYIYDESSLFNTSLCSKVCYGTAKSLEELAKKHTEFETGFHGVFTDMVSWSF